MTPRVPVHRRRRRLAATVALVTCLALSAPIALSGRAHETAVTAPHRAASAVLLTADSGGVVDITTQLTGGGGAAGTGIVVNPAGEVLTNNHVIQGATEIRVTVPGAPVEYVARVLGTDPKQDVALLGVIGAPGLTAATLGDSSSVAVGDPVKAIGNAGGVGGMPSVATGTVTALNRSITTASESGLQSEHLDGLIQTDADVQPGDSGGPLVNATGQVIGMDTAAAIHQPGRQQPPVGFAIPINAAMAIAHAIETGRASADVQIAPPPPLLGVELFSGGF